MARDWRVGLLPQVVQPGPPATVVAAGAAAASDSTPARTASTAAARMRAVFTERPDTAATIA